MNKEELKEMCSNWYEEGCKDTLKEVLEFIESLRFNVLTDEQVDEIKQRITEGSKDE